MAITFEALNLNPEIVKACRKQGFKETTPIQELVVPVVAKGRDVIVEAKTGSGKTLAYGLPLLDREPKQTQFPETLIVVPTRELAQQIEAELTRTAGALPRSIVALTGGSSMDKQRERLDAGATIIAGTVGRLEELLERKLLRLDHVRTVVLDEVDELLRGGFAPNIAALFEVMPSERQTLLFSATVPTEVETLAKRFTSKPARLRLTVARELPTELSHRVLFTTVDGRLEDLAEFLRAQKPFQTLVFCGTRHETEEVEEALSEVGLEAEFLHGELSPNKRKQLLERVRSGDLPVLVASDLAARGLDLPGVDLVVNYSLPQGTAAYLHRAGRTGRAGRKGMVLSLVIGQQHERYEKLKQTFPFQSVEVAKGRIIRHQMKTREERDLEYRKLPPRPPREHRRPEPEQKPEEQRRPPREEQRRPQRGGAERPLRGGPERAPRREGQQRPPREGQQRPQREEQRRPPRGGPERAPREGQQRPPRREGGRPAPKKGAGRDERRPRPEGRKPPRRGR